MGERRGYLRDPVGHRYPQMRRLVGGSSGDVDLRQYVFDVWDQQQTNSCVAHAILAAYLLSQRAAGIETTDRSRMYLYAFARMVDRGPVEAGTIRPLPDAGCMPSSGIFALSDWGACSYEKMPTPTGPNSTESRSEPPLHATMEAMDLWKLDNQKGRHFAYSVGCNFPDIRSALSSGMPVTAALQASNQRFESYDGGTLPFLGYNTDHYVTIVGCAGESLICLNSWGESWGENGYFRLGSDAVRGLTDLIAHSVRRVS